MERQKCENCSAPMIMITKRDGSNAYRCEYCGYQVDLRPATVSDKVFSFATRIANMIDENNSNTKQPQTIAKQKTSLVDKIDEAERAANAFDQKRRQLMEKAKKWGF